MKLAYCLGACLVSVFIATARIEAVGPCVAMPITQRAATSPPAQSPDSLSIASLNMHHDGRVSDGVAAWVRERGVDVLLLQEVGDGSANGAALADALSDRLGYHLAYAGVDRLGDAATQGLAVLSRYPLNDVRKYPLKYHDLAFRSRCRIALAAVVATINGPVQVMNVHLDTRINSRKRIAQLAPLIEAFDLGDGPQIIGGDFNTMNIGWFLSMLPLPYLQRQAAAVRTRLGGQGFQTPFIGGRPTFKFLGLPLRLDWLFLKRVEALDWSVDDVRFTDHRGVWARVRP
jgi:endonuclease/exonuclease/phosphatase family metal-dependent hydrolase